MGARISATVQRTVGVVFLIALPCLAVGAPAKAETLTIGGTAPAAALIEMNAILSMRLK